MIKLQNYTPEVYYRESRDFQFIGRLYDVVLNYIKTNTDLIYNLPMSDNSDSTLVDLVAMTLGFKSRHNYNVNQLVAICSIFPTILKYKGSIKAIELIGNALVKSEGITKDKFSCVINKDNPTELILAVPNSLSDKALLRDLLNYVLPAGMTYKVISELFQSNTATISVTQDKMKIHKSTDINTSTVLGAALDKSDINSSVATGVLTKVTVVGGGNDGDAKSQQIYPKETEEITGGNN